jgi:hypothetical protein
MATRSPSRITVPLISTSRVAVRTKCRNGVAIRQISWIAVAGTSSARCRSHAIWSWLRMSSCMPWASAERVLSAAPLASSTTLPMISSSDSVSSRPAVTIFDTTSSIGQAAFFSARSVA